MKFCASLLAVGLVLAACGKSKDKETPPPAPPTPAGSGSATPAPPPDAEPPVDAAVPRDPNAPFDFDSLSFDEKRAFMKDHVVPTMKPMFQKFDPEKFASFGCKTCHGKDPKKAKYKMPSPDLPALDFTALENGKQKPETAKWMSEVVKPEMAKLLQLPEKSKQNPKGFDCLVCHTEKK